MNPGLLLKAIGVAALFLLLLESARYLIEKAIIRKFELEDQFQPHLFSMLLLHLVFFLLLPAAIYAALYPILPFSGFRAGVAIGLFVFTTGVLPAILEIQNYSETPLLIIVLQLFWNLVMLLAVIATITDMYRY